MKIMTLISAIVTLLLMMSAMVCAFWIKAGNPGDMSVHVSFGMAAAIFCCITFVLMIFTLRNTNKGR